MKKIFFTVAVMLLSYGAFAQTETDKKMQDPATTQQTGRHANGYILKDGKVMMVKDGNMSLIQKDITLSNGTVIMADGSYMEKGKAKMKLRDGDHITTDGIVHVKTSK